MVYGGIDGYSRMIIYFRVVLCIILKGVVCFFLKGFIRYGIFSRVCVDCGGEFVDFGYLMIIINGVERGSFIIGKFF